MPRVDFCFSGFIRGANIQKASNVQGKEVDVSKMTGEELAKKLENGDLFISLGDYLYNNHQNSEVEISEFEES